MADGLDRRGFLLAGLAAGPGAALAMAVPAPVRKPAPDEGLPACFSDLMRVHYSIDQAFAEKLCGELAPQWQQALNHVGLGKLVEVVNREEWDRRYKARRIPGIGDRLTTPRYTWDTREDQTKVCLPQGQDWELHVEKHVYALPVNIVPSSVYARGGWPQVHAHFPKMLAAIAAEMRTRYDTALGYYNNTSTVIGIPGRPHELHWLCEEPCVRVRLDGVMAEFSLSITSAGTITAPGDARWYPKPLPVTT